MDRNRPNPDVIPIPRKPVSCTDDITTDQTPKADVPNSWMITFITKNWENKKKNNSAPDQTIFRDVDVSFLNDIFKSDKPS